MSAERFTILVVPEGSHHVKRYILSRKLVKRLGGLALVVGLTLGYVVVDYAMMQKDVSELARLRVENRYQQQEMQRLAAAMDDIRSDVVVLAQNDAKVRILAEIAKPKADQLNGIGGAPEEDLVTDVSDLQRKIDEVRRAIDGQRRSQEEIQGYLNDKRSLVNATPSGWPARGWLTSVFGMRNSPFTGKEKMHEGLDIAARTGTDIMVTADGVVSRVATAAGYGKLVVVDHGYGYRTYYGHNSKIYVKVGDRVKKGDVIAAVGNTGISTGPHVHYEVRVNGVPVNPKNYL